MLNLAFDTTGAGCSIAISKDGKILEKQVRRMDFGQSENLFPMIEEILSHQQLEIKDFDLITVCVGPGSFTGVRSSLSAARSFVIALPELKLTGVSAFEAYLQDFFENELAEINAVIIETKRQDFYFQSFDRNKNKLCEPQALEYSEIIDLLRHKKISLIGDGVERFLSQPSGLSLHVIRMEDFINIEALANCGDEKYNKKNLNYPKPIYLRSPDVCVKAG